MDGQNQGGKIRGGRPAGGDGLQRRGRPPSGQIFSKKISGTDPGLPGPVPFPFPKGNATPGAKKTGERKRRGKQGAFSLTGSRLTRNRYGSTPVYRKRWPVRRKNRGPVLSAPFSRGRSAVKKAPPPALAPFRRRCRTHQNPPYSLSDGRTAFPAEAPRAVSANPLREVPPTAFAPPVSGSAAPVFAPPSSRPAV